MWVLAKGADTIGRCVWGGEGRLRERSEKRVNVGVLGYEVWELLNG